MSASGSWSYKLSSRPVEWRQRVDAESQGNVDNIVDLHIYSINNKTTINNKTIEHHTVLHDLHRIITPTESIYNT